jgi:hypothetical protein
MKMEENKILYDWLFRYNHYTNLWYAFYREDLINYYNGQATEYNVYHDKDINYLIKNVIEYETK